MKVWSGMSCDDSEEFIGDLQSGFFLRKQQ